MGTASILTATRFVHDASFPLPARRRMWRIANQTRFL
jgi:hypothetical protein